MTETESITNACIVGLEKEVRRLSDEVAFLKETLIKVGRCAHVHQFVAISLQHDAEQALARLSE